MRIVFLITMGIERPSGVRYFNIARELVRQGHRVRMLALHPNLPHCPQRRFIQDGVEVWYVGQMHARKSSGMPERFGPLHLLGVLINSTFGMIWGVLCSPADVYHLGKPQPINGVAALLGIRMLRRKHFYVDCDDDEITSNHFTARWQRWLFAFWQWLLPLLSIGVTVNTLFLADQLRGRGIKLVVHVPNGFDPIVFKRPSTPRVARLRQALWLEGRRVIAYVGTVALHNHPVDLLIDAFARIAPQLSDTVLLFIGDGVDLLFVQRRVAELGLEHRVLFVGHMSQVQVPQFLALAHLSVDPVYDNAVARARSPLKLFESLALGVPVVTGNVGDRAALLDHGRAGTVVQPGSAVALADAMAAVLSNEQCHAALVADGQYHVQHYTWQELAGRWLAVYNPAACYAGIR